MSKNPTRDQRRRSHSVQVRVHDPRDKPGSIKTQRLTDRNRLVRVLWSIICFCPSSPAETIRETSCQSKASFTCELNLSWQTLQETCFLLTVGGRPRVWWRTAFCTGSIWWKERNKDRWKEGRGWPVDTLAAPLKSRQIVRLRRKARNQSFMASAGEFWLRGGAARQNPQWPQHGGASSTVHWHHDIYFIFAVWVQVKPTGLYFYCNCQNSRSWLAVRCSF